MLEKLKADGLLPSQWEIEEMVRHQDFDKNLDLKEIKAIFSYLKTLKYV